MMRNGLTYSPERLGWPYAQRSNVVKILAARSRGKIWC